MAGVEPAFERRDLDPAAAIVSANLNRRNMTVGQRAMAYAIIYPAAPKAHKGKASEETKLFATKSFSGPALSKARQVLDHSTSMAEQVLIGVNNGGISLDEALLKVREAQGKLSAAKAEASEDSA
jgi:hypothetical protein